MSRYDPARLTARSIVSTWREQEATTYPGWLYSGAALRIVGMGGSYNAALTALPRLQAHGISARVDLASDYYRDDLDGFTPSDVIVLVSATGESIELVELATRLRAQGFERTIALVQETRSPLAELARHTIPLGIVDESPIDTFVATVLALVRMGAAVSGGTVPDVEAEASVIDDVVAAGSAWVEHQPAAPVVDIIGRSHLHGVARQAALLVREIARVPASSWHPNDYRHGPMESIRSDQLTVLIASQEERTRAVDAALARDLRTIPQRVLVIGAASDPADDRGADLVAPTRDALAGIVELAALIPAIYAWAAEHDVPVGEFRYTRVTITEDS